MTAQPQPVTTWHDYEVRCPTLMDAYVKERGPLPDGAITQDAWAAFWTWLLARTHEATP